jgi:hypothetical protein
MHYALHDVKRKKWRRWYPVVTLTFAIPASISRSAVVGLVVVIAFLIPVWSKQVRKVAAALIPVVLGIVFVTMPGMLGTLLGLFSGISNDSSALSRTDSYSIAIEFIQRSPWLGRGFATFLPVYRILDNQYLGTLIELGVVGLASVLLLYATGVVIGLRIRKRSRDLITRSLGQSLAASAAAGAISFALFDAFSFSMLSGMMFFVLGAIGALDRLQTIGREAEPQRNPVTGQFAVINDRLLVPKQSRPLSVGGGSGSGRKAAPRRASASVREGDTGPNVTGSADGGATGGGGGQAFGRPVSAASAAAAVSLVKDRETGASEESVVEVPIAPAARAVQAADESPTPDDSVSPTPAETTKPPAQSAPAAPVSPAGGTYGKPVIRLEKND